MKKRFTGRVNDNLLINFIKYTQQENNMASNILAEINTNQKQADYEEIKGK